MNGDARPLGGRGAVGYLPPDRGGHGVRWELSDEPGWDHAAPFDGPVGSLGIRAITNVGHASTNRAALRSWYREFLGFAEPDFEPPPAAGRAAVPSGQPGLLDQPLEFWLIDGSRPGSAAQRLLAARQVALTHVYFGISDWDQAIAALQRRGIEPTDDHQGDLGPPFGRWRAGGIAPRDTGGISVRFSQMGYDGE